MQTLDILILIFKIMLVVLNVQEVTPQQCGVKKEVSYARIPDPKTLLYIDEFEKFVSAKYLCYLWYILKYMGYKPRSV